MLRSKSRVARRRKLRKLGGRLELPSNVATKEIAPFPRYPPESWVITYKKNNKTNSTSKNILFLLVPKRQKKKTTNQRKTSYTKYKKFLKNKIK